MGLTAPHARQSRRAVAGERGAQPVLLQRRLAVEALQQRLADGGLLRAGRDASPVICTTNTSQSAFLFGSHEMMPCLKLALRQLATGRWGEVTSADSLTSVCRETKQKSAGEAHGQVPRKVSRVAEGRHPSGAQFLDGVVRVGGLHDRVQAEVRDLGNKPAAAVVCAAGTDSMSTSMPRTPPTPHPEPPCVYPEVRLVSMAGCAERQAPSATCSYSST